MRYERQVVLQMPPKDSTVGGSTSTPDPVAPKSEVTLAPAKTQGAATVVSAPAKPAPSVSKAPMVKHTAPKSSAKPAHAPKPATKSAAKDAATHKRVEAIKAWMAKRHAAQAAGN
jgi:cell division protein FtsQ